MKRLFKFKYPKIFILILVIIFAYFLFSNITIISYISGLKKTNYLIDFLFGMLFSFGFTTPFSVGFFITSNPQNILLSGFVGGLGAMISDLFIFKFVKFSFTDEFEKLKKEKISKEIGSILTHTLGKKLKHYLMYAFAGIIIASPLPDEAGVTMLAGLTHIKEKWLAIISFICNTAGIIIMLCI